MWTALLFMFFGCLFVCLAISFCLLSCQLVIVCFLLVWFFVYSFLLLERLKGLRHSFFSLMMAQVWPHVSMNVFNTLTVQLLNIFTFHVFLCWFTTLLKFATLMNRCLQELCFYAHGSAEEGGRGRETRIYFLSLVPGLTSAARSARSNKYVHVLAAGLKIEHFE